MIVHKKDSSILGFVFLKDIFEEIIKAEIEDKDVHYDSTINPVKNVNRTKEISKEVIEAKEMTEYTKPLLDK